jgi:transcriptional regulator with XRE-family HTH domain
VDDIDIHLGRRLRRRRKLLGLTQQELATIVAVRFQQIQKYECAANRMSAARLWQLAGALEVPISYFYEGLTNNQVEILHTRESVSTEVMHCSETQELIVAYYQLDEAQRYKFLELAKALGEKGSNVAAALTKVAA